MTAGGEMPSWGVSVSPSHTAAPSLPVWPRLSHAQRQPAAKPVCVAAASTAPRDFQTLMRYAAGRREGLAHTSAQPLHLHY